MATSRITIIKEILKEQNPNVLFLEPDFDKAIIGSCIKFGRRIVAAYSSDGCLKVLMKKHNCCDVEAYEKFVDTLESKSVEDNYPVFISDFRKIRLVDLKDFDLKTTLDQILRANDPS